MLSRRVRGRVCGAAVAVVSLAGGFGYTAVTSSAGQGARHARMVRARNAQAADLAWQFAACMRAHGADQPDPVLVPGRGTTLDIVDSGPNVAAARQACRPLLDQITAAKVQAIGPAGIADRARQAQSFVACMSAHGIGLGQPQPPLYDVAALLDKADRETPKGQAAALQAAKAACRSSNPQLVS